jgi:hypothetical protein
MRIQQVLPRGLERDEVHMNVNGTMIPLFQEWWEVKKKG